MSAPAAVSVFPPLKNILYATDFSPCSQAALPYLQAISERYGAAVHVVHAQPQVLTTDRAAKIDSERYAAEVEMRAVVASGAFNNIAFTTTVASGEVWEILSTVIREKNIDAIVMGTHGRRGVDKLVLGSVTEQVIRHASCPVLTLGPEAIHEPVDAGFSRILFATDYSAGSKHALRYALSLAQANHSHLIMLHVMDGKLGAMPSTSEATSPGVQILAEYIAQALAY
jgi:nucleotide-binding universal stress UspA family protein